MALTGREESTTIDVVSGKRDLDRADEAGAGAENLMGVLWLCRQTLRS
jgi:hypothetical protein